MKRTTIQSIVFEKDASVSILYQTYANGATHEQHFADVSSALGWLNDIGCNPSLGLCMTVI